MPTSSQPADQPWSAVLLRLAVVTLPAQVVGALLGSLPLMILGDQLSNVPWIAALVVVAMGAMGGVAMGVLSRPPTDRWLASTAVAAGFGLAGFLVLRLLAALQLRSAPIPPASWVIGALLVVVVQSVVLIGVWRQRPLA